MRKIWQAVVLLFGFCFMASLHASESDAESRAAFDRQIRQSVLAGDFNSALSLFERGIKEDEERFGKDHPILLRRLNGKRQLLLQQFSDTEEAKRLATRIFRIIHSAYESGDTEKLYLTGTYLEQLDSPQQAAALFSKLVEVAELTADENPLLLIEALSHQAQAFAALSPTQDRAVAVYERVLALRSKHQGEMHLDSIADRMSLSILRERQGQHAEAERLLVDNVEIAEKHDTGLHENVRANHYNLALFYEHSGQYGAAINQLNLIINRYHRASPINRLRNPDMIYPLMFRARNQIRSRQYDGAAASLFDASEIFVRNKGLTPEQTGPSLRAWLAGSGLIGSQGMDIALADWWRLANAQYAHHLEEGEFFEDMDDVDDIVELISSPPYVAYLLMADVLDRALEAAHGSVEDADVVRAYEKLLEMRERHWPGDNAEWLALTSYTKARGSKRPR